MVSVLIHNVRAGVSGASLHLLWYLDHRTGGPRTARQRALARTTRQS